MAFPWQLVSIGELPAGRRSSVVVKLLDLLLLTEAHFAYKADHRFADATRLTS
jgi:hypothetical protein